MKKSVAELQRLMELLQIEKEEEQRLFEEQVSSLSLTEKREKGVCWQPLQVIETGFAVGDYAYIMVERTREKGKPHQFKSGSVVRLFTNNPTTHKDDNEDKGVVHFIDKDRMKIIFYGKDHPDWLTDGGLGIDMLFDERTYREMEYALNDVSRASGNRLEELREVLLGYRKADFLRSSDYYYPSLPQLNDSQNEAVRQIVSSLDVAIVHGPPGTGKTTTLVHAIAYLTRQSGARTILVCAPSNSATDLLTERLAEQGLHVTRLGNVSRVDESLIQHTLDAQLSAHPDAKHIKKVRIEAAQARREANRFRRSFGHEQRIARRNMQEEAKALSAWAKDLEDKLVDYILSSSQVITCTLAGAASALVRKMKFDIVVIDEAAQALEPATWIPIRLAKRVVLAGDPLQLPPTVKSNKAASAGLSITLLEKCINRQPEVALLRTQYRMNEVIMGFSNQYFYKNQLEAHSSVARQELPILGRKPLVFIDTVGCSFDEQQINEHSSRFNPDEFGILREHLYKLLAAFEHYTVPSIGIISPYKQQVNYMRDAIQNDEILQNIPEIKVNTIDGFQGQECDIIYISLVRSNEQGDIGFLNDYRRMNVALTRAKFKLIVIGDTGTLGNHAFYQTFLDYVELHDAYHSAWEYMA